MRQTPMEFAHVQPQAPEVEKAVLGALMIDKNAYMEVCDKLVPESFYEPRNQMVYDAIRSLSGEIGAFPPSLGRRNPPIRS